MNPMQPNDQDQPNEGFTPESQTRSTDSSFSQTDQPSTVPASDYNRPVPTEPTESTSIETSTPLESSQEVEPATVATVPVAPVAQSTVQPTPPSAQDPATSSLNVPKKSGNKLPLILAGILVSALLIGGGAFAAYKSYQSPEKVLSDAAMKAIHADVMQVKASVTSTAKITTSGQTVALKSFTFDSKSTHDPKADANAKAVLAINGNDYEFAASGVMNDNGDVYFKIVKAVDTLNKLYETMADGQKLPADALATFRGLEGKWVKVSLEDIKKNDAEAATAYKCVLDTYKSYGNDKAMMDEVYGVYKKHPFIKTEGDAKYKDGLVGYDVKIDEKVSKDFSGAMKDTAIAKKVKACDKNASTTESVEDATSEASKETSATTTVWVDQWSHELRKVNSVVKYTPKEGDASTTNIDSTFGFDKSLSVVIPTDTMSIDEFTKKVQQGYEQLTSGM